MANDIIEKIYTLISCGEEVYATKHIGDTSLSNLVKTGESEWGIPSYKRELQRAYFVDGAKNTAWKARTKVFIKNNFDEIIAKEYIDDKARLWATDYPSDVKKIIELLKTLISQIENEEIIPQKGAVLLDAENVLLMIFDNFHRFTRQLRTRHNNRSIIEVEDEYDVQDLLHAILTIYFDDIRDEEWTPSYAGGSVRTDFLLRNEGIVIEVKKTRQSMTAKKLGEELIVDIEKYAEHPNCKKLFCFVYDPEGRLGNPTEITNDLNKRHDGFAMVIIRPKM